MNFKANAAYDGTRYEGWQRQQRTGNTIQGKLEAVLLDLLGRPVQVIGAGRTDAGVHARGQVLNFHADTSLSPQALSDKINDALPDDIGLYNLACAGERFHARFHALGKHYRYRIRTGPSKNVFDRRLVWQYGRPLLLSPMRDAAALFTGTHDFTSFCGNKKFKRSPVRTVSSIALSEKDGELWIDVTGDGFLQGMIRIITGTLVEIGEGKRSPEEIPGILSSRDRSAAGFTAPPEGLMLMEVFYKNS